MKYSTYLIVSIVLASQITLTGCASPKRGDIEYAPVKPVTQTGPIQHSD